MSEKTRKKLPEDLPDGELEKAQGGGFAAAVSQTTFNTATGFNSATVFNSASVFNSPDAGIVTNDSPLKR